MFLISFLSISLNQLKEHVDGLEYVDYNIDSYNINEVTFHPKQPKLYFFSQKLKNIEINISLNGKTRTLKQKDSIKFRNAIRLPVNSTLSIAANWNSDNDFLIGFFDATNCTSLSYSNKNVTENTKSKNNKGFCFYYFSKNRIDPQFSSQKQREVLSVNKHSHLKLPKVPVSHPYVRGVLYDIYDDRYADDDMPDIEFSSGEGAGLLTFSIILACVGAVMYMFVGFSFATQCCNTNCFICEKWREIDFSDGGNDFYSKTLALYSEATNNTVNAEVD